MTGTAGADVARSGVAPASPAPDRRAGGDFTGFSGNSPKKSGRKVFGAFATQAGVGSESTATSWRTGEEFGDTGKAIEYLKDAQFRIVWLAKMPSNHSLAAPQQSGGEFSVGRITWSTI